MSTPLLDTGAFFGPLALITDRQIDDDAVFPEGIGYGAQGGPGFLTRVIVASSGAEQRNADHSRAKAEYTIDTGLKDPNEAAVLLAFVYTRFGKLNGFRFKDWTDYKLSDQPVVGNLGSNTLFQVYKAYTFASRTYSRKITRPINGTIIVTDGLGAPLIEGVDWTLDYTTGLLTMTVAPVTYPRVTGEFHVPCRLDIDLMKATVEKFNTFVWRSIPIVELPE